MSSQDALDIHQTGLLSDVTLSELQLHRQPFGQVAPDAPTFADDTSAEQLADVKQALITGDDLLLILGEHGAGKSVLLNQLGTNSGLRIQCFAVKGSPRFSTLNLFAGMLEAFKRKPPETLKDILDELIPCLQTMVARDTLSAIVLDDADQISETELTQLLSGMLYINSQEETLMRVALAAPPEFEDRIPDLLPEGADLPYSSLTIDGMNEARAADYLAFRLHEAGYASELPFSDDDINEIVSQSGGFPGSLHVSAAAILNRQYDPAAMEFHMADELSMGESESFLQTRKGKFGLGLLATALILIGLTMFVPDAADDQERFGATDDLSQQSSFSDETSLRVVEEKKLVPLPPETIEAPDDQLPLDTAELPEDTDPAEITINGSTDAAEENPQVADNDNLPSSDSMDSGDTTGDTTSEEGLTGSSEPVSADSARLPAFDTIIPDVENPPIIIVPESETVDATETADAEAPSTETDSSAELEADESDAITSADEQATTALIDNLPEQTPVVDSTPDVNPVVADILESPTWILVQDPDLITVQMSASRDRKSIESFLQRNRAALAPPNSIYSFQRNGETWYALLHGLFPSFDAAQTEVEQMPASALSDQPWIRNVGRIQTVLKAQ